MIKYILVIGSLLGLAGGLAPDKPEQVVVATSSVVEVLELLGKDYSARRPDMSIPGVSAEVGEMLIKEGFAPKPNGGKTRIQSKHFVCTSCHNTVQEDPDLADLDPQARLEYSELRGIPYLQGTTLYGAVNRDSYYNGDYYKKYGELVTPARYDIREAVKLCAVECAQGRALADWELESIIAYLWTIDLQMDDLSLAGEELEWVQMTIDSAVMDSELVSMIESKYAKSSPATFIPPPLDRDRGTGLTGDPSNGKLIYENSCLHCHYNGRYSYLHLDDTRLSFAHLRRNMGKYTRHSIYQVTRWGVPVRSGKPSYMPQYTAEKMSDQQLADLRAYVVSRS